jgi:undecaprenyl-diphosphatase
MRFLTTLLLTLCLTSSAIAQETPAETSPTPDHPGLPVWEAVLLGVVEGATEYLPVSSTGHLVLVQHALGQAETAEKKAADDALAICIQSGAILAVVFLYFGRLQSMFRGVFGGDLAGRRLFVNVVIAFLPAAVIGLVLRHKIKEYLFGPEPVAWALLVGGILILAVANTIVKKGEASGKELTDLNWKQALLIGFAQCVALFPGFSRSLATILGGLWAGLKLSAAVEFSFLLGFVTLTAATVLEAKDSGGIIIEQFGIVSPIIALVVAFVAAVLSIKFMIKLLNSYGLAPFGYYRIALAVVCFWLIWR